MTDEVLDNLVTTAEAQDTDNPQQQNDNSDVADDVTEETEDEITKERYKQQIEWSKKEVERLREIVLQTAIREATKDASTLLELHKQDPKLAEQVSTEFDWSQTERWSYRAFLKQDAQVSKSLSDEDIEALAQKKAEEIIANREHEKAIEKAKKQFSKLDEDLAVEAEKRFMKLVWNQKITEEDALEFAEMATLYVSKDKSKWDNYSNAYVKAASTNVWNSKKPADSDLVPVIREWKIVLVPSNTL